MRTAAQAQPISKHRLWTGRAFSGLLCCHSRTSILGAVLPTGYLGGVVASQLRAGEPLFGYVLFPVYFGILLWTALYLREDRLDEFIGLRS